MSKLNLSKTMIWTGIILILATGLIHLVDAPENFEEVAYKGILFYLNAAGALIAAIGIFRGQRSWGWSLGGLIALGSIVGYVISRTLGLPMLEVDDDWFEPLGVASVVVETLFLAQYAYVMTRPVEVTPAGLSRASSASQPSRSQS